MNNKIIEKILNIHRKIIKYTTLDKEYNKTIQNIDHIWQLNQIYTSRDFEHAIQDNRIYITRFKFTF